MNTIFQPPLTLASLGFGTLSQQTFVAEVRVIEQRLVLPEHAIEVGYGADLWPCLSGGIWMGGGSACI
jgi:hypothetical protein